KKDYTPAPEGLWPAVCCDVVDLGILRTPFGERPQIAIYWHLEQIDPKTKFHFMVTQRFTPSLHEKSKLRPMLEAWRGRRFNPEELKKFDIEKLIGANCQLQVIHNITTDGRTFANVQAVVPPARGMAKLSVRNDYVRVSERAKRAKLEQHPDEVVSAGEEDEYIPF